MLRSPGVGRRCILFKLILTDLRAVHALVVSPISQLHKNVRHTRHSSDAVNSCGWRRFIFFIKYFQRVEWVVRLLNFERFAPVRFVFFQENNFSEPLQTNKLDEVDAKNFIIRR
jgi:hypothetical protein